MPVVLRRHAAILDVIVIADYLADRVSLSLADRFAMAVEKTSKRLARMPRIGSLWDSKNTRLSEVRFFPVEKFPNHIVFHRPIEGGIELLHVLHGASDLERALDVQDEDGV